MRCLIALLCAVVFPASALANGYLYDCDLKGSNGSTGWVGEKAVFVVRPDGSVLVSDPVVLYKMGEPMEVRVNKNNDTTLAVHWTLNVTDKLSQSGTFRYSARLKKKSGKITITARPTDSPQSFVGRGTCKMRTG